MYIPEMYIIIGTSTFLIFVLLGFYLTYFFTAKGKVTQSQYDLLFLNKGFSDYELEKLQKENSQLRNEKDNLITILQDARESVTRLKTEKEALNLQMSRHKTDLVAMEEKFRMLFENLANKIFDEKATKFKKESQEGLGILLNPLKEDIKEFYKKMDESFGNQIKEQFSLKNEIKRIVLANEKITLQAENLTKALKGENKTQGNWGEVILEKILEDSGLRKDIDYLLQGVGMDLKNDEGGRQYPDVIVKLPEEKHIIIDSKVSLTHYERYFSEPDFTTREIHLKQFLLSVKNHINGLEQRQYQNIEKLGTPDFVLMFMPIEGAYFLALQENSTLHSYAWNKKIVIVCPSTLFATLRTVESVWRLERQNKNALEIAKYGGALYDKVASFVEDMVKLGKYMDAAGDTYNSTLKKLSEGQGNILSRVEHLKKLGVKASKQSPAVMIDDAQEARKKKINN